MLGQALWDRALRVALLMRGCNLNLDLWAGSDRGVLVEGTMNDMRSIRDKSATMSPAPLENHHCVNVGASDVRVARIAIS